MKIDPFGVEIWMNEYETKARYNLAETCVDSLTVEELLRLTDAEEDFAEAVLPMRLTYGAIEGSDRLRAAISALYSSVPPSQTIVTHGGIGANALVHQALVSRGDHVVSVVPAYQQHYSIPASIGADVSRVWLNESAGFLPDLEELASAVRAGTRLICLTNPNNPTGSLMDEYLLRAVAEIADRVGAYVLVDEVYRGTDETGSGTTSSIADVYHRGISTSSVSKAFSLAGLRLGWVAGPEEVIESVSIHRDYNTISVGMIDDYLATLALENSKVLLGRSREITRTHRALVDDWLRDERRMQWVRPKSGTTGLLRFDAQVSSRDFCIGLLEQTGVMLTPGSALGMEGYLRLGYAGDGEDLRAGMPLISEYLDTI